MTNPLNPSTNTPLHRFALLAAAMTFGLLAIGGLVTSHGVGMAVPDWPNTYGYNLFFFPVSKWVGGIFYEHTHRLAASAVGLLTCILALWLHGRPARGFMRSIGLALMVLGVIAWLRWPARWADGFVLELSGWVLLGSSLVWPRCEPSSRRLRWLGLLAVAAVVLQGVLGGLRVVLFKDQIGIFHAVLAQLFFVLLCLIAGLTDWRWTTGRGWDTAGTGLVTTWLRGLFVAGTTLILAQLVLGATMRHEHAGLAIPDFPLAYGKWWPPMDAGSVALYNQRRLEIVAMNPITAFQIGLQMAHRLTAGAILGLVVLATGTTIRRFGIRHHLSRITLVWLTLILGQGLLGAATIWSNKAADVATAHVLVGALGLATGSWLCWVASAQPARAGVLLAPQWQWDLTTTTDLPPVLGELNRRPTAADPLSVAGRESASWPRPVPAPMPTIPS